MLSLLADRCGFDEHRAGIPYTNALLGTTDVASKQPPRSMCPAPVQAPSLTVDVQPLLKAVS